MHIVFHTDDQGDTIDASYYCCDPCARTDNDYAGWNGCHETEHRTYCENCGVVIGGFNEPCDHLYPTTVNLIGIPEDDYCEHGELVRTRVRS